MRPIAAEAGQVLQLILMDEVRPMRGGTFSPDFVAAVTQRYRFMSYPTELPQIAQSFKFQMGAMVHGGRTITINSLEIYNDGILVNTMHTDDSDLVTDDFIPWSKEQFHLRDPISEIPRRYFSAVIAEFDRSFAGVISNFEKIATVITDCLGVHVGFHRLALSNDPLQQVGHKTWQIEPRAAKPFVPNRYFSTAQLRTSDHFDMLARLEALFQD